MEQPKAVIPTPEPELASIKDGPKTEIFWICRNSKTVAANDEAFELQPIMQDEKQEGDPKAGPGSTIQAHREGYKKEVVPTP
ncbi:unnamed protein product [Rhizophagus irregularis]|nr:unnamed protein product [Rhizophagus irregularis]